MAEDRLDDALWALRQSFDHGADGPRLWRVFGNVLRLKGEIDAAISAYREALRRQPDRLTHSRLLLAVNSSCTLTPAEVAQEHRHWASLYAAPACVPVSAPRAVHGHKTPLVVGYVSPDFRSHPVAYFFLPLVEGHHRENVQVVCYASTSANDGVRRRIAAAADLWREVAGWSTQRVVEQIRADGVDLLVDLAGHTTGNRLDVFACRAAPVQLTYLGYPNTTGLDSIDYRLVDAVTDPPGPADELASETLIRLEPGFLVFDPPADAPPVAQSPMLSNGYVTFGSFNKVAKLSPETLETWSALLNKLPTARLLLKSGGLTTDESRNQLCEAFAKAGLSDVSRLELRDLEPSRRAHLAMYGEIDIALDPFPYNGTTTTCQALWMGVPMITLAGRSHAGRVGASLFSQMQLQALVAPDRESYLRIAVGLAASPEKLADLRRGLRDRMAASPLLDHVGFVARLEALYRRLWQRACQAGA
ncbi:O-linked N-acetylglucosamine transferase, SPINDLY family protein [Thiorhodovibrio winogradskyi]|uniref:O-linked N-acetylglucosamine transferase, SPINDLY family protein n=1 Tax=Thiorhodovibrio winogradskyi TaxID=77007 RepID=UPI002E2DCBFA|nr:hypothetical protein [Thiorhodovibrio winogradskyi]